jgi:hypothetical protein
MTKSFLESQWSQCPWLSSFQLEFIPIKTFSRTPQEPGSREAAKNAKFKTFLIFLALLATWREKRFSKSAHKSRGLAAPQEPGSREAAKGAKFKTFLIFLALLATWREKRFSKSAHKSWGLAPHKSRGLAKPQKTQSLKPF